MVNFGQEKTARRRIREVLAEDELDVKDARDEGGGVGEDGGREGGREDR